MAFFVRKEKCPACRAVGKDRHGDNLARYSNGSAFCFSCRYHEFPTKFVPRGDPDDSGPVPPPPDLCRLFNAENIQWLKQYLTNEEIADHFLYSPSRKMHVYKWADYWEGRSVNPKKVLSHGTKPFRLFGKGDTVVVVEDVVSAIKVARVCRGLPLFGSNLSGDWMVKLLKEDPKRIIMWLDADKYKESRLFSAKLNALRPGWSFSVKTDKDPKCYSTEDIRELVSFDYGDKREVVRT